MPRVTITVADRTPQPYRFPLDSPRVTIGRGSENDIAVDCGSVSVKHAEMVRVSGGYELHDLGSTNGMKENGVRKSVIQLTDGGSAKLGDVLFEITLSPEEKEALGREEPTAPRPPELPAIQKVVLQEAPALEAAPAAPAPRQAAPVVVKMSDGGSWGFGAVLLFLILAATAFFAGMAIRYQKETGGNLIEAIKTAKPSPAGEK